LDAAVNLRHPPREPTERAAQALGGRAPLGEILLPCGRDLLLVDGNEALLALARRIACPLHQGVHVALEVCRSARLVRGIREHVREPVHGFVGERGCVGSGAKVDLVALGAVRVLDDREVAAGDLLGLLGGHAVLLEALEVADLVLVPDDEVA